MKYFLLLLRIQKDFRYKYVYYSRFGEYIKKQLAITVLYLFLFAFLSFGRTKTGIRSCVLNYILEGGTRMGIEIP